MKREVKAMSVSTGTETGDRKREKGFGERRH